MGFFDRLKNFFKKKKNLLNAPSTNNENRDIIKELAKESRIVLRNPESLSQYDIEPLIGREFKTIFIDSDYRDKNIKLNELDFSYIKVKGLYICACETSSIKLPKDIELIDLCFAKGIDFNSGGVLNIPEDSNLKAININIHVDDLTPDCIEALKKVKNNCKILITIFQEEFENFYSTSKSKYTFLIDQIISGEMTIESVKEELRKISEDPEYAFKSDPRYKQFNDCMNGKKIEDISDSLKKYITFCYPAYPIEDNYWIKADRTVLTEESLEYRKKLFQDNGNEDKVLVIPGDIANEFCNHPKLKGLLDISRKIHIDLSSHIDTSKSKFDLIDFIKNKIKRDYELGIRFDDLSLISDDLIETLDGKHGVKILLEKAEIEPIPAMFVVNKDNSKSSTDSMDSYDYMDIKKLKNIFDDIIMKVPNGISTEEKVNFLYNQLKSIVKIKKMDEDPKLTEFYDAVYGLTNIIVDKDGSRANGKKAPKIEYKSILRTLETGEGNPKDFLDTFYFLLKYSNIECNLSPKSNYISLFRTYTKEFATLDNSLIPIRVRSIDISLEDGRVMKINKFIEDFEMEEVSKVKKVDEEQL